MMSVGSVLSGIIKNASAIFTFKLPLTKTSAESINSGAIWSKFYQRTTLLRSEER